MEEEQNFNKSNLEILSYSAEKINENKHKYLIIILKTEYHHSIFINQTE